MAAQVLSRNFEALLVNTFNSLLAYAYVLIFADMDAVTCALLVLCALIALKSVDNWRQLRRAPGPALASITDFWRAWHQYRGQLREKLVQLHEKHGPIVRYGVRSLSISDPSAINVIYGSKGFVTVCWTIEDMDHTVHL